MVCRGLLSRETVECYPTLLWCFLSGQAQWVSLRLRFVYCAQLDIIMTELKHLSMEEWTREWEGPPQVFFSFFQLVKDLFQRARLSDRQAGREAGAGRKWGFFCCCCCVPFLWTNMLHILALLILDPSSLSLTTALKTLRPGRSSAFETMGLSIHYQLAHFESFSHGRNGCGATSAFFPKLFCLLTQPAVLYSRAILSYPSLRNCNFSYVFITSISLWLITRHKQTQKCLPSIFLYWKQKEETSIFACELKFPN